MSTNVGRLDQYVRIVLGLTLVAFAFPERFIHGKTAMMVNMRQGRDVFRARFDIGS